LNRIRHPVLLVPRQTERYYPGLPQAVKSAG